MKKYTSLGELLIDFRKHRNLSQLDFAAMMDVDARTVIRWEKNVSLIKVEKERILTETFKIPHQVIRNLNTDMPIAIYFDFDRWTYALSNLTTLIKSADDFIFDEQFDADNIETLSQQDDFDFITYIQENQKVCSPLKVQVLKLAAHLLPELNLVLYGNSGFHAGHICFLPLKYETYLKIYKQEIAEHQISENDLSRDENAKPKVFYFYSLYANSHDHAHYIVNRLLHYFKIQKFDDYIFTGTSLQQNVVDRTTEMGLDVVWTKHNEACGKTTTFVSGNLDNFLFKNK